MLARKKQVYEFLNTTESSLETIVNMLEGLTEVIAYEYAHAANGSPTLFNRVDMDNLIAQSVEAKLIMQKLAESIKAAKMFAPKNK